MKHLYKYILTILILLGGLNAQAQMKLTTDATKKPFIALSMDTIHIGYNSSLSQVSVLTNTDYTLTSDDTWFTWQQESKDLITLFAGYFYQTSPRYGHLTFTSADKSFSRTLVVAQDANTSASTLQGDIRLTVTGSDNQHQSGQDISYTQDGSVSTLFHSPWSGTSFPVILTYTLPTAKHIDYVIYTPRQDGNSNGNFGAVKIEYTLASAPSTWITLTSTDFGGSSSATSVDFGDAGIDNVKQVRFTVTTGSNGFASCAEMGFYQKNQTFASEVNKYFTNSLCYELKSDVSEDSLSKISNPYLKQLAYYIHAGDYSTKFRLGTFQAYRPVGDLASELKTSYYNSYENPTGIYFRKGDKVALFVEGLGKDGANLIIKSFGPESYTGEGQPQSSYHLANGVNVITAQNRGNSYVSYYTLNYKTAPQIKIHFAMALENGYFDLERGDTDADWTKMLANACSDIMDMRTKRIQVAFPTADFKKYSPTQGRETAILIDSVIWYERNVMGLAKYGREPENRQFARCVTSGMFADGTGAAAAFGSVNGWLRPTNASFEFWGFAHELGHVNQVRPGLKWVGCGETTNNIYSSWVEHSLGTGYHRLEDENTGVDSYSGMRGGRFEAYLEEGVRKGNCWQLQDGPDYHGNAEESVTVNDENYVGVVTGTVTTVKRNYDHFVKVVPFYQLMLYCNAAKKSPDAMAKVIEGIRTYKNESALCNGRLQLKFMRSFCDSTHINFLPFFEKAGMLKPINHFIEDYSAEWLKISKDSIDLLKADIARKGYPQADSALNYINAYNFKVFRDQVKLAAGTVNAGCAAQSNGRIRVDNTVWSGVVGYETYDANGQLLRITMFGLGDAQKSSRYTYVLWPTSTTEKSAYIMAVGYDGTRVKCYQP